jgi:hypothetical protein
LGGLRDAPPEVGVAWVIGQLAGQGAEGSFEIRDAARGRIQVFDVGCAQLTPQA